MEGLTSFLAGAQHLIQNPTLWVLIFAGCFFGIVFGAIPGLTGALAVTLLLPFTYSMSSTNGITLLIAVYVGSISGGLISAVLLNIPGTPASVATTFDGSPMAKQGRAGDALLIGVFSSFIGGVFSGLCLVMIAPKLAKLALVFGSWEYFGMGIMGLCVVVSLCAKDRIKGFMSAIIGLILAMVGMDPVSSVNRLTFGQWQLGAGLSELPTLMGLFALAEVLAQTKTFGQHVETLELQKIHWWPRKGMLKGCGKTMGVGALIGTFVGILPGVGQGTASMLSYTQAQQTSKHPESFGTGIAEGVVASEVANNAVCGGALIPMMALAVPGDLITAVLLGALTVHGIQPGPQLFTNSGDLVGVIFFVYVVANFVMYLLMMLLMRLFVKLLKIPLNYLLPSILLMCVVGAVTTNNRVFDAWVLYVVGVAGYVLLARGLSVAPMVLGFILGKIVESNFRTGVIAGQGSVMGFFSHPIAMGLVAFGIFMAVWTNRKPKRKSAAAEE
ncbi:tripartite tricarboxylate transporter permease [Oscillibacter sp.]|uniref:tripartite tricarboxylate transporter permease n=1 Tax=Oscillibacter sp. TaxID=1945593 RepID=UPI002D7F025D|nr:tripartite tricarboxylate transporter permease [Oscillibacter sp.]